MFDPSWNSAMQVISDEQARQVGEPLSDRLLRTYSQRNDAGFDVLLGEVEKLCDENVIMRESLKLGRVIDARCQATEAAIEATLLTFGCNDCGEERQPIIVAGKLTCPECGSERIVCIEGDEVDLMRPGEGNG